MILLLSWYVVSAISLHELRKGSDAAFHKLVDIAECSGLELKIKRERAQKPR